MLTHGRRIVARVLASPGRIGQDRRPQLVVRIEIRPPHALVDHLLQIHVALPPAGPSKRTSMPDLHKNCHYAGVLAHGPVALGTHAAVDKNLRHRVAAPPATAPARKPRQGSDVIHWVVVADVLQRVCNTRNEIFLLDDGHKKRSFPGNGYLSRVTARIIIWPPNSRSNFIQLSRSYWIS